MFTYSEFDQDHEVIDSREFDRYVEELLNQLHPDDRARV